MRFRSLLVCIVAAASAPIGAHANPVTQDACAGMFSAPTTWKQLGNDVLENLLFSHDSLFVSDSTANGVRRFDASGAEIPGGIKASSPGALVEAPDGSIYAGTGDALAGALQRSHAATVVKFDPSTPSPTVYASGLNMVNGMTITPNGDLFVSNDVDTGLYRIPSADPAHPVLVNDTWGTNGLVFIPGTNTLYSAITFDQRSPIEATDTTSGAHHTAFQLSFGALSLQPNAYTNGDATQPLVGLKGLDDMTTDGSFLYVVANGMGELLRVDIQTGAACVIASGLPNLSSVRIAPHGSDLDVPGALRTFYTTDFHGAITRIAQLS